MASFLEPYKTETGNFLKQVLNGNVKARVKKKWQETDRIF